MSVGYRVVRGVHRYPVGDSLRIVLDAGGLSKVPPEIRASLVLREVGPGDACDDMPTTAIAERLASGDVERVADAPKKGSR